MGETRDQNLKDMKSISDAQERLHFQLSLSWENRKTDTQKVREQVHELKLLQFILYFFIFSGIITFFILILIDSHLLIIIIDVGVVVVYISYLKYLTKKYRKILAVTKKEYKYLFKIKKKNENLQLIFYSFIFITTCFILPFSIIGLNTSILIITLGTFVLYIYFDTNIS